MRRRKNGVLKRMKKIRYYLYLHLLFLMYSLGAVCSKAAGRENLISIKFFLLYGMVLLDLFLYAIIWQKILKRLPLATAYANKAVTVIWGLIWGKLFLRKR